MPVRHDVSYRHILSAKRAYPTDGWRLGRDHGRFVRRVYADAMSSRSTPLPHNPSFLSYTSESKLLQSPGTPSVTRSPSQTIFKTAFLAVVSLLFFGIPQTYLAHAQKASEFTGRLVGLQNAWQSYTRQLTKEYTDFVIAVSFNLLFADIELTNDRISQLFSCRTQIMSIV